MATKQPALDEPKRLTFWIVGSVARQLKRNAKVKNQKFPVYLANLVRAGMRLDKAK